MTSQMYQLFIALFAITNAVGAAPVFLSLTSSYSSHQRVKAAIIACLSCFIILLIAVWTGAKLLGFFGVSIASFEIAGGIIVIGIGLKLINGSIGSTEGKNTEDKQQRHSSIAVIPMAMPLLAGPGTISTLLLHMSFFETDAAKLDATLVCFANSLLALLILLASPLLVRLLKESGMMIITRIMGLMLTAIAVQMFVNGVLSVMPKLA
jgi:MarC family membrane protein